ncbi:sugar phosphate isomerase/epimerase family protein [Peptoniphilus sp.]|uniref:sugar phosphate isomerase/epimerase family protein n=1 Tax=Peptoniphilus sp. TaxID=1971214 RepID=UPI003D93416C
MIYISTNMYRPESFEKVYRITDALDFPIGIEIFPFFNDENYEKLLQDNFERLKNYEITFHEPYNKTDHSYLEGEVYDRTLDYFNKMLKFKDLNPKYIVYHYNNRKVDDKEKMLEAARKNLDFFGDLTLTPLLIENVGVDDRGNKLLDEDEFIEECLTRNEKVLIDIGHANANGWDMENLISSLKEKIVSYHLHTNDGRCDEHRSIFEDGKTPDINKIISLIKKYTPEADLVIEYLNYYEDKEDLVTYDIKKLKELL